MTKWHQLDPFNITLGLSSNESIESLEMVHSLAMTYEDFVRNKGSGIS
jgi:hypothetical protein